MSSVPGEVTLGKELLYELVLVVRAYEGIEYSQDVPAVFHDAGKYIFQLRIAFSFAVPLREDSRRHLDVAAQMLRGMPAQEKAVEKRSFALRKVEIVDDFGGHELWQCGHRFDRLAAISPEGKGSLLKTLAASSSTHAFLPRAVQYPISQPHRGHTTPGLPDRF